MVTNEFVNELAASYPEVEVMDHFGKPSFRVRKKIFATLDVENRRVCLKLSAINQSVFSAFDKEIIYPVPNAWGKQGWTFVELKKVRKDLFKDALTMAYCDVAPKKLSEAYRQTGSGFGT